MSTKTKIEWTASDDGPPGRTWNPVVGCLPERLEDPLHWRKQCRVFVNSMSDLFHKEVPFEFIDRVFAVMVKSDHVFQVLTKRPERMAEYLATLPMESGKPDRLTDLAATFGHPAMGGSCERPIYNVWIGTSVEDQATADERVDQLLSCPAAVRFLSVEPLLGPVTLNPWLLSEHGRRMIGAKPGIHWVIVGGQSGPGARPCNLHWIRSIIAQCRAADVPCFVKQLGANPVSRSGIRVDLSHRKGGDWTEWPPDLRVREYPK